MSEPPIHIDGPVNGDAFTGDKITIDTGGGDYYEAVAPIGLAALHQLPSPPADFTGRAAELAELRQAIQNAARGSGAAISGLRGLGGVGKTALALVLANALAIDYPDAQIFLDLRGVTNPLKPEAVMAHVIRAYKPVEKLADDHAQLAAAYRSVLHGQRALLLFDNAASRAQVEPLIPPPSCLLLITSREKFTLPGLRAVNLDILLPADAQALLLKMAPRIGDHAATLAELCAFLPLALTLAGSALAEREDLEPAHYARRLRAEQGRLGLLKEVEASLALSYDLLSPELQPLWRALSVFPSNFDAPAAAAVWSLDSDPASDRLGDLLRFSLLEFDKPSKRYRVHDLARDFARSRLSETERDPAQRRHAEHYIGVLSAAGEFYLKGGEGILRGLALYDLEAANILAGQAWAAAHMDQDDNAAQLASDYPNNGVDVLDLRQHPREVITWSEAGLAAARRLGNKLREGNHLGNLGSACFFLGETRRAIEFYEQQLVITRETGDRRGEGAALNNLGLAYAGLGETRRAIEFYEQQLVITRETGDRRREGNTLGNLGLAYVDLGETRRAIEYYEQDFEIAREIGDRRGEEGALSNLGSAYYLLGETARAIEYHERAIEIDREIGDRRAEGGTFNNLGLAYAALGETRRAIELYEQTLAMHRQIGERRGEAGTLNNLGLAYAALGEPRRAIEYYEPALVIHREIGDRREEGNTLGNLGGAYVALGETPRAIGLYEQQLAITHETGDRAGESRASWNLGLLYAVQGDFEKAIAALQANADIERELGHPNAEPDAAKIAEMRAQLAGGSATAPPPA